MKHDALEQSTERYVNKAVQVVTEACRSPVLSIWKRALCYHDTAKYTAIDR